jgi:hypothetical protein
MKRFQDRLIMYAFYPEPNAVGSHGTQDASPGCAHALILGYRVVSEVNLETSWAAG